MNYNSVASVSFIQKQNLAVMFYRHRTELLKKLNRKHHLDSCIWNWSPHFKKLMDGLGKVLIRAIRHLENTAYEGSLKGFDMFSLEKRRQRGDMVTNVWKAGAQRSKLLLTGQKAVGLNCNWGDTGQTSGNISHWYGVFSRRLDCLLKLWNLC